MKPKAVYRLVPNLAESGTLSLVDRSHRQMLRRAMSGNGDVAGLKAEWEDAKLGHGDFVSLSEFAPIISARVCRQFTASLERAGKLVPLDISKRGPKDYLLYVVEAVVDCLDTSRSTEPDEDLGEVEHPVFLPEKLEARFPAFRLPGSTQVYWHGDFVDELSAFELRGVKKWLVWSEDPEASSSSRRAHDRLAKRRDETRNWTPLDAAAEGSIEAAFGRLTDEYAARKARAEKQVCRWRWASFLVLEPTPLYFERNCLAPGRFLWFNPFDPAGCAQYGFDAQGRVVVVRNYTSINKHAFYETFLNWDLRPAQVAHYDYFPGKRPINLTWLHLEDARVVASTTVAEFGRSHEAYHWEADRVTSVVVERGEREDGYQQPMTLFHTARADYDERGRLSRVALHWPANPPKGTAESVELVFERRRFGIWRRHP